MTNFNSMSNSMGQSKKLTDGVVGTSNDYQASMNHDLKFSKQMIRVK